MTKKLLAFVCCALALGILFSAAGWAENDQSELIPARRTTSGFENAADNNDDLFQQYMRRELPGLNPIAPVRLLRSARIARESLTGASAKLYDALLPHIQNIASGEETSTEFSFTADELGMQLYSAEELGVETLVDDSGYISDETFYALLAKDGYDDSAAVTALLNDCPYDLYWFDKSYVNENGQPDAFSSYYSFQVNNDYTKLGISNITFYMQVAEAYQGGGGHSTNPTLPQRVQDAAENIEQIISSYSASGDLEKLTAYRNEIRGRVEYDHEAAASENQGGDPWQLIYVFDNDETTNVVCEGYSKAFKYLCDLSEFIGDVHCILVSGTMQGGEGAGAHMWNIVKMPDGKNYMADITNDHDGSLFMTGYQGLDDNGWYRYAWSIYFHYDQETLGSYDYDTWLSMSDTDYQEIPCAITFEANGLAGEMESDTVILGYGYELPECGFELGPWDQFVNWQKDDEMSRLYAPGETVIITADTVFTAIWNRELPAFGTPQFVLPKAIQTIGAEAFQGTDPGVVYIPRSDPTAGSGVQSIEDYAFADCPHLWQIYIPASVTSIGEHAFEGCSDELIIYGAAESFAQEYAEQFGIPFVEYYPQ